MCLGFELNWVKFDQLICVLVIVHLKNILNRFEINSDQIQSTQNQIDGYKNGFSLVLNWFYIDLLRVEMI